MAEALGPLEAYEAVLRFAVGRGEDAVRLASHAALPQVLRPELLHLLRLNFVPEALDDPAVEADVLLAPFCESLGNGYYRFDAHARRYLARQLDPLYGDGSAARSQRVARFLLSYFDQQREAVNSANDIVYATYLEIERWVALGFYDAEEAATQLANAIRRSSETGNASAKFRFGGLSGALAIPLGHHQEVLSYTEAIEALEYGQSDRARELLEPLGEEEAESSGLTLPAPRIVLEKWTKPTVPPFRIIPHDEGGSAQEVPVEAPTPVADPGASEDDQVVRDTILISYSHRDQRWLERLQTFLLPVARPAQVEAWSDASIRPGRSRDRESRERMRRARVVVLLVSADYLASEFVKGVEFQQLETAARNGELTLFWVCVSACAWRLTALARFQALVDPSRPLDALSAAKRSEALMRIADAVARVVEPGKRPTPATTATAAPIFLCYRRGADDGYARRLADRLRAAYGPANVFQDISRLKPGDNFREVITRTVDAATVMLVVIGRGWVHERDESGRRRIDDPDDFVRLEVAAAMGRNMRVVPILVGNAQMPSTRDLPPDLAPLAHRQAVQLRDGDWDRDFDVLKSDLDKILGESHRGPAPTRRDTLRVFLSSTYQDLEEQRSKVAAAITRLAMVVVGAEMPDESSPPQLVLADLATCDVMVCIVAWRYGHVPKESWNKEKLSITELVYREAQNRNIPVLAFLLDESTAWPVSRTDRPDDDERVGRFRKILTDQLTVQFFSTSDDLAASVTEALIRLQEGVIRQHTVPPRA